MSKGSKRRPSQVDAKTFSDNWERAFTKPKEIKEIELQSKCLGRKDSPAIPPVKNGAPETR